MKEFAVNFNDLKKDVQEELLAFYQVKLPEELNLDALIPDVPEEKDEKPKKTTPKSKK